MAAMNTKSLKQWYRDSSSLPKKVIAKSRYLFSRIQVQAFRWGWTFISLPALLVAGLLLKTNPQKALVHYTKLAKRNPWIGGSLTGKLRAAQLTGDISLALSAALERDRLHAKNYGVSAPIWREYLATEPNWQLPTYALTGDAHIELTQEILERELANLNRRSNYAESELAVVCEQLADRSASVSVGSPTSSLNLVLVAIALGVKPVPFTLTKSGKNELETRQSAKIEWLCSLGLVAVTK